MRKSSGSKGKVHTIRVTVGALLLTLAAAAMSMGTVGCTGGAGSGRGLDGTERETLQNPARSVVSRDRGPTLRTTDVPGGESRWIALDSGDSILVENHGGQLLFTAEAVLTGEAFQVLQAETRGLDTAQAGDLRRRRLDEIAVVLASRGALLFRSVPAVGYLRFQFPYSSDLLNPLNGLELPLGLQIEPVRPDRVTLESAKAFTPATLGLPNDARSGEAGHSGLDQLGALEFARIAGSDADGAPIDGSTVRIGVGDTGLTLNHPTFLSRTRPGASRIGSLKDFTREGRIYFGLTASFAATPNPSAGDDGLLLEAEYIGTGRLPRLPAGDKLGKIFNYPILASSELRAALLDPLRAPRLGFLKEESFNSPNEQVDINANGKTTDEFPVLLLPGQGAGEADLLYVDFSAQGDFRNVAPLRDFNSTGDTAKVFAERMGFHIQQDELPGSDGASTVPVLSASLVGFDPGNHGTHVSGIAAGSGTFSNSGRDTLARGFAPEATLLVNRVCSNNAGCDATEAFIDLVIEGGVDVVNLSLGGLSPSNDGYGVEQTLINRLSTLFNVTFMISAGNSGPGRQTVGSPSTARLALSIGATASRGMIERQYQWPASGAGTPAADPFMLFFSSRGPTAAGGFKPNITAPGTQMSSVQLNSAPGTRSGLDVYWGTSMAAPAATGAYALLLDAVRKYNAAHPETALSTDASDLRAVLLESARAFDRTALDSRAGTKSTGDYGWQDEGTGQIDLPAAWSLLKRLSSFQAIGSELAAVRDAAGKSMPLDYQVWTELASNPSGLPYDGSRSEPQLREPLVGNGLYLDFNSEDKLESVYISRRLPEGSLDRADAGDLHRQLVTSRDRFALRTVITGSQIEWLKAGVRDELDCDGSESADLTVAGRGAELAIEEGGTGSIIPFPASALYVCVDRRKVWNELPAGEHGALIYAYRKVDRLDEEGRIVATDVEPIPSFIVPVSLTVPHRELIGSQSFDISGDVKSFGVKRHTIRVPEGTTLVQVTLEVPALKRDERGRVAEGESCSAVELAILEGINTSKSFESRRDARATNCTATGAPAPDSRRTIQLVRNHPRAGTWDIDVLGMFRYRNSKYRLRIDYLTGKSSVDRIEGVAGDTRGTFEWTLAEASLPVSLDAVRSGIRLSGLIQEVRAQVADKKVALVPDGAGNYLRKYRPEVQSVTFQTGGAEGNDLDMQVLGCSESATSPVDPSCRPAGQSAGPTDEEEVQIYPDPSKQYVVVVRGYVIPEGRTEFVASETLEFDTESYGIEIRQAGGTFQIGYALDTETLASSLLATLPEFTSGTYGLTGELALKTLNGFRVANLPVRLSSRATP